MWWAGVALAAELELVGFSPTGHLFTAVVVEPRAGAWQAEVQTLDVDAGTWNHLPVTAQAPSRSEAVAAALAGVKPGYAAGPGPGEVVRTWAEGSRAHEHGTSHAVVHHLQREGWEARLTLTEVPTGRSCDGAPAVEPWVTWTDSAGTRERLVDRVPRRWSECAVGFELDRVWVGPRGRAVGAIRVVEMVDGGTRVGWLLVSR